MLLRGTQKQYEKQCGKTEMRGISVWQERQVSEYRVLGR